MGQHSGVELSGSDIFISYAREDEGVARLFAQAFGQEGFNVWWDAAIHSGETFDEVIENELRNAKAVVVLWSPRSVASRWVRAEATLADRNKTLAPAIIEPCNRPIIFELTHTVDLSHWTGDIADTAWQVFVNDIRRLVGADRPVPGAVLSGGSRPRPAEAVAPAHHKPGAQAPAPASAPPPAATSSGDMLGGGNVENLISMLSSLQQAINLNTAGQAGANPAPAPAATPPPAPRMPEPEVQDESEATQFYTHSDHFSLLEGNEFHCLEVGVGDEVENRYVVGPLGLKIGRSAPADVILADSKVSRSHCLVEVKDDTLFVTDLNSTNGTYVDGKKVAGAAIVPVGGILTIGHYSLAHQIRKRDELA
jgi:hypothetical protein